MTCCQYQYSCKSIDCHFETNDLDEVLQHTNFKHHYFSFLNGNINRLPIKCFFKDCIRSFTHWSNFITHTKYHLNNNKQQVKSNQKFYKCFCDSSLCFSSIFELKWHYVSHIINQSHINCFFMFHIDADKSIECPYKSNKRENFLRHIHRQHNYKTTIQNKFVLNINSTNDLVDLNKQINDKRIDFVNDLCSLSGESKILNIFFYYKPIVFHIN